MVIVGNFFGFSGFWVFFIFLVFIGFVVYRISDLDSWGFWDVVVFFIFGGIFMLVIIGDLIVMVLEFIKGVMGFGLVGVLVGLVVKNRRD